MDVILIAGLLGFLDDEDEIDHVYYYDSDDGPVSESDRMDDELEDIEYKIK